MVIGYIFTLVYLVLFASLIASVFLLRKRFAKILSGKIDRVTILAACAITAFFVVFALLYVHPVEQLYFDENIYQGIALNILHNGNALWCQYGTAYLSSCSANQIYHDPVEISFYLAIAFAIFGTGIQTAYGMELAIGAISILLVFLLSSSMFGKKTGVASALVFALIPELFIWSRTQAVPDLMMMMFAILAFFAYDIYRKDKGSAALMFFLSAVGIAVYVRIEAVLLLPIFAVLYLCSGFGLPKPKKSKVSNPRLANSILIIAFMAILLPQAYYISYEGHSLDYGSGSLCNSPSEHTFSVSNFLCNLTPNTQFFLGADNSVPYYPAYFAPITTIIAIIGAIIMAYRLRKNERIQTMLMLGLWVFAFHIFYDFFYAGSALYGVDVRFMLIVYPPMAVFAGFGIASMSDAVIGIRRTNGSRKKASRPFRAASMLVYLILLAAFAVFPFYNSLKITTISPSMMPQESMPMAATNFIYHNAASVPPGCLVFSFTPDIWYELNRSAAQVGYVGSTNATFKAFESQFSCFVFDSGYWCTGNGGGFKQSTCIPDIKSYNSSVIASQTAPNGIDNFTFYRMNGYTT